MNNKQTYHPLSFISTVSGKIDTLLESLESKHKSEKNITKKNILQLKENSCSILYFKEQIHKWKQETHSQIQQQILSMLEQKLYRATNLNSELLKKFK